MFYEFENKLQNPYFEEVLDVNPQEVLENSAQLYLVDVREEEEFLGELGHVATSKLVNLSSLPENIKTFPRDQTIVFICRSGARSAQATSFALQEGFTSVFNMRGGMVLWNHLALPIEN